MWQNDSGAWTHNHCFVKRVPTQDWWRERDKQKTHILNEKTYIISKLKNTVSINTVSLMKCIKFLNIIKEKKNQLKNEQKIWLDISPKRYKWLTWKDAQHH